MKLLFAHDNRFTEVGREVYSDVYFAASEWARYLEHFEQIIVAGRQAQANLGNSPAHLVKSSTTDVSFQLFENLSTLRGLTQARKKARARMQALVANCDAVIARLPSEIGLLAASCADRQNRAYAIEVVGCPWDGLLNYGNLTGVLYAPIARARMRRALARASFAIYVTQNFLQSRYPCPGKLTAAVSDIELPEPDPAKLDDRLNGLIKPREGPLQLGLIGTLNGKFKGIQTVLEALGRLGPNVSQYRFHVLGPGEVEPWKDLAERYGIEKFVQFDGTLPPGAQVLDWIDRIDLYLQPSLKEGLPRALIEAMSRGCPAIGSSAAGIPELLDSGDLIKPGSAKQLTSLLSRRAGDVEWMQDRARRNWNIAQRYTKEHLQQRRNAFWKTFRDYASENRQTSAGPLTNSKNANTDRVALSE